MTPQTVTVVVSKYNENTTWTAWLPKAWNVLVFDKSSDPVKGSLPLHNVGREAETWLQYIVTHYHNISDTIIFLEGEPTVHSSIIRDKETFVRALRFIDRTRVSGVFAHYVCEAPFAYGLAYSEYFLYLFNSTQPQHFCYVPGAQYVVPRASVLARTLRFYRKLHDMASFDLPRPDHVTKQVMNRSAIDAWTIERLWRYIWDVNVKSNPLFV